MTFRHVDMWLEHQSSKKCFIKWRADGEEQVWGGFKFMRKLRASKEKIKFMGCYTASWIY